MLKIVGKISAHSRRTPIDIFETMLKEKTFQRTRNSMKGDVCGVAGPTPAVSADGQQNNSVQRRGNGGVDGRGVGGGPFFPTPFFPQKITSP